MIYTVGFAPIPNTFQITRHTDIQLKPADIVFVNCRGSRREVWEREHQFSPVFRLAGLLPTPAQALTFRDFIMDGGTIITTVEDPYQPILTTAYKDEIKETEENLTIHSDGCTLQFEYYPYNWLIGQLSQVPYHVYEKAKRTSSEYDAKGDLTRMMMKEVALEMGSHGGKLVFTTALQAADSFTLPQVIKHMAEVYGTREEESCAVKG